MRCSSEEGIHASRWERMTSADSKTPTRSVQREPVKLLCPLRKGQGHQLGVASLSPCEQCRARRLFATKPHYQFIHVAPAPVFAGLGGADYWVAGVLVVGGGVFAYRVVAAADVAAGLAHAEVDPLHSQGQALLTSCDLAWKV